VLGGGKIMKRRTQSGLLLVSVLLGFCGMAQAGSFFKVGEPAPNFTLTSLDGQPVSIEQFKGKVVVLGLFHICRPCLEQGTNLQ
jgi:cytochrome c biogenesis protein CcmG/thiol:disulfide interchange protein DsbE